MTVHTFFFMVAAINPMMDTGFIAFQVVAKPAAITIPI